MDTCWVAPSWRPLGIDIAVEHAKAREAKAAAARAAAPTGEGGAGLGEEGGKGGKGSGTGLDVSDKMLKFDPDQERWREEEYKRKITHDVYLCLEELGLTKYVFRTYTCSTCT